jgi:hypothetical protein
MTYTLLRLVGGSGSPAGSPVEREPVATVEAGDPGEACTLLSAETGIGLWLEDDPEIPADDGTMVPVRSDDMCLYNLHWRAARGWSEVD